MQDRRVNTILVIAALFGAAFFIWFVFALGSTKIGDQANALATLWGAFLAFAGAAGGVYWQFEKHRRREEDADNELRVRASAEPRRKRLQPKIVEL